jgi:beta-barrel assembly-enhancing protease
VLLPARVCRPTLLAVTLVLILLTFLGLSALAKSIDDEFGANEIKMGKQAADEVAKDHKLSDNAADLKRVRDIGNRIAGIANKQQVDSVYGSSKITPFEYTFNIIEEDDINAFCVPGGSIYVYRGLLNFVESDQELAAVLAHEVTHASHHHMVYLLKKQASMQNTAAIALLAAMIGGSKSSDLNNILLGVQLYQIAKVNGYGMQAERDSDRGAVYYMHQSGFNPVGLLTFLERLAKRPEFVDYGIYRSHPIDAERVQAAKANIVKLGLPINRRDTTHAIKAEVKPSKVDGDDAAEVVIDGKAIYRPAPAGGKTAQQRAEETAEAINTALDAGLRIHELKADPAGAVTVRGLVLMMVLDEDAKRMYLTPGQTAEAAATAIRNVVWKQIADTLH